MVNRRQFEKLLSVIVVALLCLVCYLLWVNGARCMAEAHADPLAETHASRYDVEFVATSVPEAVAMIRYWIRLAPRHPMANQARQQRFAKLQVAATETYGTPLSLTMAMMFKESSGRPGVIGKRGEVGLMQVHPLTSARFCKRIDMSDPRGQVICGHKVLRYGYDRCGTWKGALTWYASSRGACEARPGSNLAVVVGSRFKLAAKLEIAAQGAK
jgi:hypothetical protein